MANVENPPGHLDEPEDVDCAPAMVGSITTLEMTASQKRDAAKPRPFGFQQ